MSVKVNEVANFEHERSGASQSEKFGNLDANSATLSCQANGFKVFNLLFLPSVFCLA